MRQHKLQQCNTILMSRSFPVYVLTLEEVEDCYKCFKYGARTWNMNPIFLHQNDSFALLDKVYLNIGSHACIQIFVAILHYSKLTILQKIWCHASSVCIVT